MNTATFGYQHTQSATRSRGRVAVACVPDSKAKLTQAKALPESYWNQRATELLSAFDDDDLPTTSGRLGSTLY